jgi:cytochrome c-type biogenesis protein CcmE
MTEVAREAADPAGYEVGSRSRRPPGRFGSRRLKLFIVLAALGLGVGYLAVMAARSGTAYYVTPSELLQKPSQGTEYRVGGRIVPGSIQWDSAHKVVHFLIADASETQAYSIAGGSPTVGVAYDGVVPNLFAEKAFVVLGGRYAGADQFAADSLVIKHESEFITEKKESVGQ